MLRARIEAHPKLLEEPFFRSCPILSKEYFSGAAQQRLLILQGLGEPRNERSLCLFVKFTPIEQRPFDLPVAIFAFGLATISILSRLRIRPKFLGTANVVYFGGVPPKLYPNNFLGTHHPLVGHLYKLYMVHVFLG